MSIPEPIRWALALALILGFLVATWAYVKRQALRHMAREAQRTARRLLKEGGVRISPLRRSRRQALGKLILADPEVQELMAAHGGEHRLPADQVTEVVERYVDEIVSYFNVFAYYRIGYRFAQFWLNTLYEIEGDSPPQVEDEEGRPTVSIFVMNHRSNVDYVLMAYQLVQRVSISYAVGEWARVWPLEPIFKSFGAYFIRRGYREPLYHKVLERYVQYLAWEGVDQGIFLEGGLSKDGRLREPKIGLLDYILQARRVPGFDRKIRLVPAGINYDRVLEDRSLLLEQAGRSPNRLSQMGQVGTYFGKNLIRLARGRFRQYGYAAVAFGEALDVEEYVGGLEQEFLSLPKEARRAEVARLADLLMARIAARVPVTPVPLICLAIVRENLWEVRREVFEAAVVELWGDLGALGAPLIPSEGPDRALEVGSTLLRLRQVLRDEGGRVLVSRADEPLVRYYANSIAHYLG